MDNDAPKITTSALAGIGNLPASEHAQEQLRRAAKAGFKWPNSDLVLGKIKEEIGEAQDAMASGDKVQAASEIGDVLHAVHTLVVFLEIDIHSTAGLASPLRLGTLDSQFERVRNAVEGGNRREIATEIGHFVQVTHRMAEAHGIQPDAALASTNAKFEKRFTATERILHERGQTMANTPLKDTIKIWNGQKDTAPYAKR